MASIKDMTGQRVGWLVVLSRHPMMKSGQATWLCLCDCEKQTIVTGGDLRRGSVKSCGCRRGKFALDLTGQRFTRLVVLSRQGTKNNQAKWLCQCDCGQQKEVSGNHLRSEFVRSCGCLLQETSAARFRSHGKTKTRVYRAWKAMRQRCSNPANEKNWKDYGGRGIRVCERWQSFENFYADMGDPPEGTSLDRIDFNGNYEPSNCRWATDMEQARNKRNNVLITYRGETRSLIEWSEHLDLNYRNLVTRLTTHKWSVERTLETPTRKSRDTRKDGKANQ